MTRMHETYDLPERSPVPFRQWALMLAVPALALGLWLILPDSPVTVALLVIVVLVTVFLGVHRILRSRQLTEPPRGNETMRPPSVGGS